MKKVFLTGALVAACALAQGPGGRGGAPMSLVDTMKQAYTTGKNKIIAAAEQMSDEGYAFQPTKEERNFGGWVAHVADSQIGTCSALAGAAKQVNAGQKTSKADLVAALKESFDSCDAAFNGTTDANANENVQTFQGPRPRVAALYGTIGHNEECYGSMAVYMRLQQLVPPSSAGRGGRGPGQGKGKQ